MQEGSEHILTNYQETDSRGPFTEVAGSDCHLQFCLLRTTLRSRKNLRHRKLESAAPATQEQDLVLSQVLKEFGELLRKQFLRLSVVEQREGVSVNVWLSICHERFLLQRHPILIFLNSTIYNSPFH